MFEGTLRDIAANPLPVCEAFQEREREKEDFISPRRKAFDIVYDAAMVDGFPVAKYYLSHFFSSGFRVSKDQQKALELIVSAAEEGDTFAQYDLGLHYLGGKNKLNIKRDFTEAKKWFNGLAKNGGERSRRILEIIQSLACFISVIFILPNGLSEFSCFR